MLWVNSTYLLGLVVTIVVGPVNVIVLLITAVDAVAIDI